MSNFLSTMYLKTAKKDSQKFSLNKYHLTTAHWLQYQPTYIQEMIPGSTIKFNMDTFTRLDPLPTPTLGKATIYNRQFFVPFRVINKEFNDFITQQGSTSTINTITSYDLFKAMTPATTGQTNEYFTVAQGNIPNADIHRTGNIYWTLKPKGAYYLKLLKSLGYDINLQRESDHDIAQQEQQTDANYSPVVYSIMPLMAAIKIYVDYYVPAQYSQSAIFDPLYTFLNTGNLTSTILSSIVTLLQNTGYDPDYFTSAYDSPNSPNYENTFPYVSNNPQGSTSQISNNGGKNEVVIKPSPLNNKFEITEQALNELTAISNLIKRFQIVGSRVIDRFRAIFGIDLGNVITNRSEYLGENTNEIVFDEIFSTANTSDGSLGDYAGRGYVQQQNSNEITYEAKEFGYFINITTILPRIGYCDGYRKLTQRINWSDFYNPDFDNLGTEPISIGEFNNLLPDHNFVFGFTPRYSSYKMALDDLTGNFLYKSQASTYSSWNLFRRFRKENGDAVTTYVKHDVNFTLGKDSDQYNRIFYSTDGFDKMIMLNNYYVEMYAPMLPVMEEANEPDEGQVQEFDVNGTQLT